MTWLKQFIRERPLLFLALLMIPAALIRIWLLPGEGFTGDLNYFRQWSISGAKDGVVGMHDRMYCDYPPVYLYFLKVQGMIWRGFFGDAGYMTSKPFGFFLKLPAVIFDFLGTFVLFYLLKKPYGDKRALLGSIAYLFNPAVMFDSAYWGQIESILVMLFFGVYYAMVREKPFWVTAMYVVAIGVKFQTIILLPILALFLWKHRQRETLLQGGLGFVCALIVCFFPYLYANRMDIVLNTYLKLNDWYPYISMNAYNLWWIVSGAKGTVMSDSWLIAELITPKQLGMVLFGGMILSTLIWLYRRAWDLPTAAMGICASVVAFYVFPTQMHERYLLPAFFFMSILIASNPRWLWIYVPLSFISLWNMIGALVAMYPDQAPFFWPSTWAQVDLSIFFSVLMLILAGYLIFLLLREWKWGSALVSGAVLFGLVFYITPQIVAPHRAVPLNKGPKLLEITQGWGSLQYDRSVQGSRMWIHKIPWDSGFGTHARSLLTFRLDQRYQYFEAYAGLDDEQCRGNEAQFEVRGDGRTLWQGTLFKCMGTWPQFVRVPVAGVQNLTLLVNEGNDNISCDHADWADPVLYP